MKIKEQLRHIVSNRRRKVLLKTIDSKNLSNPIYLVSFPKSGNTCLRFILANLLSNEENKPINFKNCYTLIPDSHVEKHYKIFNEKKYLELPVQIIKSHDQFNTFYKKKRIIYIVREGKSALQSYYHYTNSRRIVPFKPSDFIKPKSVKIKEWHKHLVSWDKDSIDKLVIKYENLKTNPYAEVVKVLDFLNLSFTNDEINQAIDNSSFKNMQAIEKEGYFNDNRINKNEFSNFVRSGLVKSNENIFTEKEFKQFEKKSLEAYERYNYNTDYI